MKEPLGLSEPLDMGSETPVYEQIGGGIKAAIARGAFVAGDQLPSVRGLARTLLVNPNTIVRVYRELELAGLLVTQRGRGVFVAEQAGTRSRQEQAAQVESLLREAVELARQSELEECDLQEIWRRLSKEKDS